MERFINIIQGFILLLMASGIFCLAMEMKSINDHNYKSDCNRTVDHAIVFEGMRGVKLNQAVLDYDKNDEHGYYYHNLYKLSI